MKRPTGTSASIRANPNAPATAPSCQSASRAAAPTSGSSAGKAPIETVVAPRTRQRITRRRLGTSFVMLVSDLTKGDVHAPERCEEPQAEASVREGAAIDQGQGEVQGTPEGSGGPDRQQDAPKEGRDEEPPPAQQLARRQPPQGGLTAAHGATAARARPWPDWSARTVSGLAPACTAR